MCDVCYMLLLRDTGGKGWGCLSVTCAILGCAAQVCVLAAVLCGTPADVCPLKPDNGCNRPKHVVTIIVSLNTCFRYCCVIS